MDNDMVPVEAGAVDVTEAPDERTNWQGFVRDLTERQREIAPLLPSNISWERFKNTAVAAIKQNPEILQATARSVFGALTKAAQDGLLPDGREGFINVYRVRVKRRRPNSNAVYEESVPTAAWMPMLYGLRKRARELGDIIIDAQAVYQEDTFVWHQGDNPHIEHVPAALGKPRGPLIGAYAIFRDKDATILHREVMDRTQIEMVRGQSRNKDGLLWSSFPEEGYRKTVVRRGIKTVPVSEKLEQIVRRDDDEYAFSSTAAIEGVADAASLPAPKPTVVAISGPPKAPPRAAVAQATGGSGPAPENPGRSLPARADNPGPDGGSGAAAPQPKPGEPAPETGSAAHPPGVGADGKVHMLGLFQEWAEQQVASATDASDLYDIWETRIEPWRERMPADWFKQLKAIQKAAIDAFSKAPADETETG